LYDRLCGSPFRRFTLHKIIGWENGKNKKGDYL